MCQTDFDLIYTNALSKAASYSKNGHHVVLKDLKGNQILTLTLVFDKPLIPAGPVLLTGIYAPNIQKESKVLIQFTDSQAKLFGGCNAHHADYKANSNGNFNLGIFIHTSAVCLKDTDRKYTDALSQAKSFIKSRDGTLAFMNQKGNTVIILSPVSLAPKQIKFNKTYKTNLNQNRAVVIKFDLSNKVSILNGCNGHTGAYKAKDDGSIQFGPMLSTKRFCINDSDTFYTKPLSESVRFKLEGERIALYSQSGKPTLLLTPHKVFKPPIKNLCQNVKCWRGTQCQKGKCVAIKKINPVSIMNKGIFIVPVAKEEKVQSTIIARLPLNTEKAGNLSSKRQKFVLTVQDPNIKQTITPNA